MGERLVVWMFRTGDAVGYRRALASAIEAGGGRVLWDSKPSSAQIDLRVLEKPAVCLHYLPYLSGSEHLVAKLVGSRLNVPWIVARVQEGNHWDYSLFSAAEYIHSFSTRATYWGKRAYGVSAARAAAARLALEWGIETRTIERYHRPWDAPPWRRIRALRRRGRAYAHDKSEYGDIWQLLDFIRALGGEDVMNTIDHSTWHAVTSLDLNRLREAVAALSAASHPHK